MAQRLAPNLYRLDIPLEGSPLKNLNSYLLTGERNLLIDTGFRQDACRAAMDAQLRELGIDLSRTDIFLTHLHSDHAGLSTELHRPGCRIFVSASDGVGLMHHGTDAYWHKRLDSMAHNGFTRQEMEDLWGVNPAQSAAPEPFTDYTYVGEGQLLRYGGYTLRVVETPGHTPGHLCLYDQENRRFFAGDHVLFRISPNICRWEVIPDALGSYLDSLRKVRTLPVEQVLTGHRETDGNFAQRVDELLAHHQRRLRNTVEVLATSPDLTAYQLAGEMRWRIRCDGWADFPLTQKFFAVGETLAHLDYLALRGFAAAEERDGQARWRATGDPAAITVEPAEI